MAEISQRPDAALAEILSQEHDALSVHQEGLDTNVEKLRALNELMNICSAAKDEAGENAKKIVFENPNRITDLLSQVEGITSPELDAMLVEWVDKLEEQAECGNPQRLELSKKELKQLERELSTSNRQVEMDIQAIMNRFSYFKDMLYQKHTIAQSTMKSLERLFEAFTRIGRY